MENAFYFRQFRAFMRFFQGKLNALAGLLNSRCFGLCGRIVIGMYRRRHHCGFSQSSGLSALNRDADRQIVSNESMMEMVASAVDKTADSNGNILQRTPDDVEMNEG